MSDHPSTFGGSTTPSGEQAWADRAAIVPATESGQLSEGVPIRRGTFAEMISHIAQLPEGDREGYVIQMAGDRIYTAAEAMVLASEPGFPAEDGG